MYICILDSVMYINIGIHICTYLFSICTYVHINNFPAKPSNFKGKLTQKNRFCFCLILYLDINLKPPTHVFKNLDFALFSWSKSRIIQGLILPGQNQKNARRRTFEEQLFEIKERLFEIGKRLFKNRKSYFQERRSRILKTWGS